MVHKNLRYKFLDVIIISRQREVPGEFEASVTHFGEDIMRNVFLLPKIAVSIFLLKMPKKMVQN